MHRKIDFQKIRNHLNFHPGIPYKLRILQPVFVNARIRIHIKPTPNVRIYIHRSNPLIGCFPEIRFETAFRQNQLLGKQTTRRTLSQKSIRKRIIRNLRNSVIKQIVLGFIGDKVTSKKPETHFLILCKFPTIERFRRNFLKIFHPLKVSAQVFFMNESSVRIAVTHIPKIVFSVFIRGNHRRSELFLEEIVGKTQTSADVAARIFTKIKIRKGREFSISQIIIIMKIRSQNSHIQTSVKTFSGLK